MAHCWSCLLCVLLYISSFIWHSWSVSNYNWILVWSLLASLDLENKLLLSLQVQMPSSISQIMLMCALYSVCPKLWTLWVKIMPFFGSLEDIILCQTLRVLNFGALKLLLKILTGDLLFILRFQFQLLSRFFGFGVNKIWQYFQWGLEPWSCCTCNRHSRENGHLFCALWVHFGLGTTRRLYLFTLSSHQESLNFLHSKPIISFPTWLSANKSIDEFKGIACMPRHVTKKGRKMHLSCSINKLNNMQLNSMEILINSLAFCWITLKVLLHLFFAILIAMFPFMMYSWCLHHLEVKSSSLRNEDINQR